MSNLSVDLIGEERVYNFLARFAPEVQDAGLEAGYTYLLDVLRTYPPPSYVTREAAYGVTFFSDKQRRWFFANLNDGTLKIPYPRTQALRKAWRKQGEGQNAILINDRPGVEYVIGDKQSRHEQRVGWKTVDKTVEERREKMEEKIRYAVEKVLKKAGA